MREVEEAESCLSIIGSMPMDLDLSLSDSSKQDSLES